MNTVNLSMKRGDSAKWSIACTRSTGGAVDLTGATLRFFAKRAATDPDSSAVISKSSATGGITITDAPNGLARVSLAPADTATLTSNAALAYDLQVTEADGTVTTLAEGTLTVTLDVTQAS